MTGATASASSGGSVAKQEAGDAASRPQQTAIAALALLLTALGVWTLHRYLPALIWATVFARIVHHPGSHIPERSYLRSSLAEMADQIETEMKAAVIDALRSQMGS